MSPSEAGDADLVSGSRGTGGSDGNTAGAEGTLLLGRLAALRFSVALTGLFPLSQTALWGMAFWLGQPMSDPPGSTESIAASATAAALCAAAVLFCALSFAPRRQCAATTLLIAAALGARAVHQADVRALQESAGKQVSVVILTHPIPAQKAQDEGLRGHAEGGRGTDKHGGEYGKLTLCSAQARVLSSVEPGSGEEPSSAGGSLAEIRRSLGPESLVGVRLPCQDPATGKPVQIGQSITGQVSSSRPPPEYRHRWAASLSFSDASAVSEAWYAPVLALRSAAERSYAASAPDPGGRLAAAMVYGGDLGDESTQAAMKAVGLSHLSAVSGANFGTVAALVLLIARLQRLSRRAQTRAVSGALLAFACLCGPEPSVIRALSAALIASWALLLGSGRNPLAVLGAAVSGVLLFDPYMATELGFQLSVCAASGILLFSDLLTRLLRHVLPSPAAGASAVCLSALLACHPVLSTVQTNVPGLSLAANLLIAPVVPVITVMGVCVLLFGWVPWMGPGLAVLPNILAEQIARFSLFAAAHPSNQTRLPIGADGVLWGLGVLALLFLLLVLFPAERNRRDCALVRIRPSRWASGRRTPWSDAPPLEKPSRWHRVLAACAVLAIGAAQWKPAPQQVLEHWQMAMCDVGQGDAAVIRTGAHRAVLIDTGPDPEALGRCLDELGITEVTDVFLSHLHADHIGGMPLVRQRFPQAAVRYSTLESDAAAARVLEGGSAERVTDDQQGSVLFREPGVVLTLVRAARPAASERQQVSGQASSTPHGSIRGRASGRSSGGESEENAASMVLLASIAPIGLSEQSVPPLRVLFTGDLESDEALGMNARLKQMAAEPLDVLKVAHHGARNGGTQTAAQFRPRLCLIGVGAGNSYGHPHQSVLDAIQQSGCAAVRTDESGLITVASAEGGLVYGQGRRR